jgi:glycosyltransferase involved in cell wall biosynthesis
VRILVVSQYFPPDMGAPAGRFHDFGRAWVDAGHHVTVLTGLPHFPSGRIQEDYRRHGLFSTEEVDGITVKRCWIYSRAGRGGRPLAYATFLVTACMRALFDRSLGYDVVIATSPPPSVGVPGIAAAWRRRVPLVVDIRDIWPEAIVQSGRLRNPALIWLFESMARLLYRVANRITTVTSGWKSRLVEVGVPAEKVEVLPNGVDIGAFDEQARSERPEVFEALDPDAHWITYAGIFNSPQGLDIVLDGFQRLKEKHPEAYARCQLVLVGEGPREEELRHQARSLDLERVVFVPRQPRAAVFSLLRRSFAVLVTLRPRKDTSTVPSKLYECLASGRPVLFQGGGEGAEAVRRADAGSVVTPGDPDALAEAISRYVSDPGLAEAHGTKARAFVEASFDRKTIALDYLRLLTALGER